MALEDLGTGRTDGQNQPDKGALARDRLELRSADVFRRARRVMFVFWTVIATSAILVAGFIGWVLWDTRKPGYMSYNVECKVSKNDVIVTGTRNFGQPYIDFAGVYRYHDLRDVKVKTSIDLDGSTMEIVGLNKDSNWWVTVGKGEFGSKPINPAEKYVMIIGGKERIVFTDGDFCK